MENRDAPAGAGVRQWLLIAAVTLTVALSSVTTVDRYAEAEFESLFDHLGQLQQLGAKVVPSEPGGE